MLVIPAIDIRHEACVMLTQGNADKERVFSDDPVKTAGTWIKQGAQRLHIIDLDGAFSGSMVHIDLIANIKKNVTVPVQTGGGIRTMETLAAVLSAGIEYAIISTAAFKNPLFLKQALKKYGERIIVALDTKYGKVAVSGWTDQTELDVLVAALELEGYGVKTVLFTSIEKDGMMKGADWKGIENICHHSSLQVIVSGGFSSEKDIEKLHAMSLKNCIGVVIGKALYTGDIKLNEAIKRLSEK